MTNRFRIVVHLTLRQEKWLREKAAKLEVSMSEILRRAIDNKIEEDERKN